MRFMEISGRRTAARHEGALHRMEPRCSGMDGKPERRHRRLGRRDWRKGSGEAGHNQFTLWLRRGRAEGRLLVRIGVSAGLCRQARPGAEGVDRRNPAKQVGFPFRYPTGIRQGFVAGIIVESRTANEP
jgi:hypothetical protein